MQGCVGVGTRQASYSFLSEVRFQGRYRIGSRELPVTEAPDVTFKMLSIRFLGECQSLKWIAIRWRFEARATQMNHPAKNNGSTCYQKRKRDDTVRGLSGAQMHRDAPPFASRRRPRPRAEGKPRGSRQWSASLDGRAGLPCCDGPIAAVGYSSRT